MPALDIGSYTSQFFFLCVVLIIALFISIKFILPDAFSINQIRNFLLNFTFYQQSKKRKVNVFSKSSLNLSKLELKDEVILFLEHKKKQLGEKFFLSPFVFFFLNDNIVLLVAFFISLAGLFFYLRTIDFSFDWRALLLNKIKTLSQEGHQSQLDLKALFPTAKTLEKYMPDSQNKYQHKLKKLKRMLKKANQRDKVNKFDV